MSSITPIEFIDDISDCCILQKRRENEIDRFMKYTILIYAFFNVNKRSIENNLRIIIKSGYTNQALYQRKVIYNF